MFGGLLCGSLEPGADLAGVVQLTCGYGVGVVVPGADGPVERPASGLGAAPEPVGDLLAGAVPAGRVGGREHSRGLLERLVLGQIG